MIALLNVFLSMIYFTLQGVITAFGAFNCVIVFVCVNKIVLLGINLTSDN